MFKKLLLLAATATSLPALAAYEINFPADTKIATDSPRVLKAVSLGDQSAEVNQQTDHLLFHDLTASAVFTAEPSTAVQPSVNWEGTWMHGYVYVDYNNDGEFDPVTELVSYVYNNDHNSAGVPAETKVWEKWAETRVLPAFKVPALKAGDYRMRYVIDWNSTDPKGRNTSDNSITTNNGAIADVTLRITADAPDPAKGEYAINFPADTKITHNSNPIRRLISISLNTPMTGNQDVPVGQDSDLLLFHDRTDHDLVAVYGAPYAININWTGSQWMNTYFYIDLDNNGVFDATVGPDGKACGGSELIAYSNYNKISSDGSTSEAGNVVQLPSFYIPENIPLGTYHARFKIDWDNIDAGGSADIIKDGGAIVDFMLTIADKIEMTSIKSMALNSILLTAQGQALNDRVVSGSDLTIKVAPTLPGFAADKIIVRHGEGETLADTEIALPADGIVTIPGEIINGENIIIYAIFEEQADSEWTKVWGDEFNSGLMDSKRWSYHPRYSAAWNRYIAQSSKAQKVVNRFEDGSYHSYCIKNTDFFTTGLDKNVDMISGAIYSGGKFTVHYGKIEARAKTNKHVGNFPAFWMMPANNAEGGWPRSGEIDIWEQINTQDQAHSTIHSGWSGWKTYNVFTTAPKQNSPANSHGTAANMDQWHVYALEWDENELRFYVDGVHHFTYAKQNYHDETYTENICWPFYKDFYIILNQSVGNGSWASNPDLNYEYHTEFDYVRVYKKKGDKNYTTNLKGNGDDPHFYVSLNPEENPDPIDPNPGKDPDSGIETVESSADSSVTYFDMNGRRIYSPAAGGVYIRKSGNQVTKVIL